MRTLDLTHVPGDELRALSEALEKIGRYLTTLPRQKEEADQILQSVLVLLDGESERRKADKENGHWRWDTSVMAGVPGRLLELLRVLLQNSRTELVNGGHLAAVGILDELITAIEDAIPSSGDM